MKQMVRILVVSFIAILIGIPLIAGGHKYIAYPVIFVHGFNADMGSWGSTKSKLQDLYINKYGYLYRAINPDYFPDMNYGAAKLGEFSKNGDCTKIAISNKPGELGLGPVIYNAIEYLKSQGVPEEEQKVILVCHSFGGLVTRSLLKQNETVNPLITDPSNKPLPANYFKSHIAKVIFVGVPHQGSPLASALWILKDVDNLIGDLIAEYRKKILSVGQHQSWLQSTDEEAYLDMLHLLIAFRLTIVNTIATADIGGPLSINAYGSAIEQCRLNKSVSFNKVFNGKYGLTEYVHRSFSGSETFLGQGNNLGIPSRFSTIYAEAGSLALSGILFKLLFDLGYYEPYFTFPAGEDIDGITEKGDVVVSSQSQRLAGATHQYFLPKVAHFGVLTPGECDQYSTIREALCEDVPLVKIERPFVSPSSNIYTRGLKGRVRDYLPLDCQITANLLNENGSPHWTEMDVPVELNPNYEESKDNYQGMFREGQLPLFSSDVGKNFKLVLKPINADGIEGAEQSLNFIYSCFIDTASVHPKDGDVEVPTYEHIIIPVKENLRTDTVNKDWVKFSPGDYEVKANGTSIEITPIQPMTTNTEYTVTIKGDDPATEDDPSTPYLIEWELDRLQNNLIF